MKFDGSGYSCVIIVSTGDTQTFRRVNFYSTGASYDGFALNVDPKILADADRISPLFNEGYLVVNFVDSPVRRVAQDAIVLDPSGTPAKRVKFASPVSKLNMYARNSTIWHWMDDSTQSWSIVSYYLPKFKTYGT